MYEPSGRRRSLSGADDDGLDDVALLRRRAGMASLTVATMTSPMLGVAPTRATEHTDAAGSPGHRVVGDTQPRLLLNHVNLLDVRSSGDFAAAWRERA